MDPSPALCTTGDWGVELRGSYASKIFQFRLEFDCLSTPYVRKRFVTFLYHGLTQLHEYDQDFPPNNSVD